MKIASKGLYRIIDANLNRLREGIRVCEDIVRFVLEDDELTGQFQKIRHQLVSLCGCYKELIKSRDVDKDVAKDMPAMKRSSRDYLCVFTANIQRIKEALRVLEEITKIVKIKETKTCMEMSECFRALRFKVYGLEKKTYARLSSLCHLR